MLKQKKIVCIIPARLNSSRFPQKILSTLANKPLLQHVWEATNKNSFFDDIIFAIDSKETAKLIASFNGKYLMTSESCNSGTERLIEILKFHKIKSDIWINWQADEPFISPEMIQILLSTIDDTSIDVWTLKKFIFQKNEILSPNVVKVICDKNDFAIYFSRYPIPYYRNEKNNNLNLKKIYYKHIGIYAFTTKALEKISKSNHECYIEKAEKLEQLNYLFNNLKIKVNETKQEIIGIDTLQDLKNAEKYIRKQIKDERKYNA